MMHVHAITQAIAWPYHQAVHAGRATKNKIRHARSFVTVENFKELVRQIFILIGKVFRGLGVVASAPAFLVEFLIKKCTALPTKYKIGTESHLLNDEELAKALEKLEKPARKVACLEFVHPAAAALNFNERAVKSLINLLPEEIISKNSQLSLNVLNALETDTHYYRYDERAKTYELKRKIFHLVLPLNRVEALHTIDSLVAKGERVVNVFFFGSATRSREELRLAMQPLNPKTAHEVAFCANNNLAPLLPLLSLSEKAC